MAFLNYHHLRYFYTIATEGSLTRAAEQLNLSQSALSIQLKKLEESFGFALFDREHKGLVLTEEGRIALDYAETIVRSGDELLQTLVNRGGRYQRVLRVGAAATLSRNFQLERAGGQPRRQAPSRTAQAVSLPPGSRRSTDDPAHRRRGHSPQLRRPHAPGGDPPHRGGRGG